MTTSRRPLEAQANAQRDPSKFPPGGLSHPCQCLTAQQLVQMDPERSEQERRQVGDEWILNGPSDGDQPDNAFGARHNGMLKTRSRQPASQTRPTEAEVNARTATHGEGDARDHSNTGVDETFHQEQEL
ncbi:hypothetical protein CSAL01_07797 [Colletotrichum salicis]|uniref:Uncharacterized protein n=1 Tax=Colletotrichum salicis TaxID=1209931 RepID=A0A135U4G1_9PEZI|nr:hypothetical protein CSAL01_07797 [Colletotrichum salicis]